jgi:hypothetical protein
MSNILLASDALVCFESFILNHKLIWAVMWQIPLLDLNQDFIYCLSSQPDTQKHNATQSREDR